MVHHMGIQKLVFALERLNSLVSKIKSILLLLFNLFGTGRNRIVPEYQNKTRAKRRIDINWENPAMCECKCFVCDVQFVVNNLIPGRNRAID